jgi:hypothetical protein
VAASPSSWRWRLCAKSAIRRRAIVSIRPGQDENLAAVREMFTDLLKLPEAKNFMSGMMSGLDVEYPGVGPRMIDLDLTTEDGPTRMSRLMHSGRGVLLSFDGAPRSICRWADRVDHVRAKTDEDICAVLVRPDDYIAGSGAEGQELETALARWFG